MMIEEKTVRQEEETGSRVVYNRLHPGEEKSARGNLAAAAVTPATALGRSGTIAPTLTPLLIGFALLLALVVGLGAWSVRRLNDVSERVLDLERHRASKVNFLLGLREALTKLNNEARARAEAEVRGALLPPFSSQLRRSRREVSEQLLPRFERLPLAQTEKGREFGRSVQEFLDITENLDQYSLAGFEKFRKVDVMLNEFLRQTYPEQENVERQSDELQSGAGRDILRLTMVALVIGALVAAGTVWEVQRRFRQMRHSLSEAERERQFSTQTLEGMVSAVAATDERHCLRSANAAFFELFPEAKIGASLQEAKFAAPEARRMLEAATSEQIEEGTYHGRWGLGSASDGAQRVFDVYSSPLEIDGGRGGILTLVDVTEVAEAEAEMRRKASLAAVGQATAQVAHEIKNPLGSIRLGVSMLRDMTRDPEAISTINLVEHGIDHLNKLTVDVTQFSRQRPLIRSTVDLHTIIAESIDLIAHKIREKQTVVEKHWAENSLTGEFDADQLRQVFVNLSANALDASQKGRPISISTERVAQGRGVSRNDRNDSMLNADYARVTVADCGSGMDEKTRARIFEPFFTTKQRGTGLGLAIAKKIVEQHGGRITVTSVPGEGTQFILDLPLLADRS